MKAVEPAFLVEITALSLLRSGDQAVNCSAPLFPPMKMGVLIRPTSGGHCIKSFNTLCFRAMHSKRGFPGGSVVKKKICLPMQEMRVPSLGWEAPGRRAWQPTPVFLLGESRGQRSPGRLRSIVLQRDTTEATYHTCTHYVLYPLQCSCLENPTDRRGWQATTCGVSKGLTQLST